jgi:hypothetical protein
MKYRMNDASFWVPDNWYEQTLHMLTSEAPGKPGISLVVHHEILEKGKTATSYKDMSLSRFPLELPGFKLLKEKEISLLNGSRKGWLLEHTWQSDTGLMHHYQAVFVIAGSTIFTKEVTKGYSFTMSLMEALHKPDLEKTFINIISSFNLEKHG